MPTIRGLLRGVLRQRAGAPTPDATGPSTIEPADPQGDLSYFVLNILDHCNLRCRGCDHFSAIASKRFVAMEDISRDLARMSELFGEDVERIGVMGGEPLLHPRLEQVLTEARRCFPATTIQVVTNGILLLKQADSFWDACRRQRIVVVVTKYPIGLDYAAITGTAKHAWTSPSSTATRPRRRRSGCTGSLWTSQGDRIRNASFARCFHANNCVLLMEGKLYTCTVAPNVRIFNERFGTHLPLQDEDSLDIHRTGTRREVLQFLRTPKPFCRYCKVSERSFGHPWERSAQQMDEWTE